MKKLLPLALLVLAAPAFGQSCGSGLPSWMVCNTSTETLSVPHLTLTGGTSYAAGEYIVSFDANDNLTYTPYNPVRHELISVVRTREADRNRMH
jgi:hypothetical protein